MPEGTVASKDGIITCDACPVLCRIREGRTGACDRYGNIEGVLTRMDPFVVTQQVAERDGDLVSFEGREWDGSLALPPSSPASDRARPIRTTNPRRSSLRANTKAWTW